ncbi:transcription factor S-II, central domain-containing protein [Lipomyces kononenkoae]
MTEARRKSAIAIANAIESSVGDFDDHQQHEAGRRKSISDIGSAVEAALFDMNNGQLNRPILRDKLLNLKHNPTLAKRLANGEITPVEFARMTNEDMASAKRKQEIRTMQRENLMQHVTADGRLPVAQGGTRRESFPGDISALEAMINREGEPQRDDDDGLEYEDH